jgi:putative tryptophan/tyrosine transport system substrate-binding protein
MRRRDFSIGVLLAAATRTGRAQEATKRHRIPFVIPSGLVARIDDPGARLYHAIFEELRRLGDIEGQTLTIERYSGEGRPEGYLDLARQIVNQHPDVIVASSDAIAQAVRAANGTIPVLWIGGDPILGGLAASPARPGGSVTGATVYVGPRDLGEAAPYPQGSRPFGIQGRVSGDAHGLGSERTTASGSGPKIGDLNNWHAATGVDAVRISARVL